MYDLIVIGAGSGGLGVGRRAAQRGASVAIIEEHTTAPFGTCVRAGCVPKKITWTAANMSESISSGEIAQYGFTGVTDAKHDYAGFVAKRDAYIQRLQGIYERNVGKDGVTLVKGSASFVNATTVRVEPSGEELQGKRVVIATGGRPSVPTGIPGSEHGITSDGFFELKELPKKALVVGAGYIAVELAGIFSAFHVDTTLAVRGETFLRHGFDKDAVKAVTEEMAGNDSFHLKTKAQVSRVDKDASTGLLTVTFEDGSTLGDLDCLLWAIGRAPNVERLNLDKVGVTLTSRGFVEVNEYQETVVPNIYALGDVCGHLELTPVAIKAGRAMGDRLFGGPEFAESKMDYSDVPTVVFSHPPMGVVGLTEEQAREKHGDDAVKIYSSRFVNMHYSMCDTKHKTYMKLVCVGPEERVVGVHTVGLGVDEMLQGFALALKLGATKKQWDSVCAIHPTGAEELVTMR
jgi:glutathione reductase (NADPH)